MKTIIVNDMMQTNYSYSLTEPIGHNFHFEFQPQLSPEEMLSMGVFGGRYMTDCRDEFPKSWFLNAKLSPNIKNINLNYFQVDASLPLSSWRNKGWLYKDDPRGWFQWYCRYYMGRRIVSEDLRQIKRWKAMRRHIGAIKKYCVLGDLDCRKKQRQALLHWSYDSRII
ncbi:MAG: hypothetical protein CMP50_07015 [Flavobacteriales bacterium]|jgi:hypothetical protein|nr:hypothetical protein [Flavobacteriales bacterium]|tara:strand:- start:497 stop:1000 length:504 start_codon:yes stop_codon:yes gene_type:complete